MVRYHINKHGVPAVCSATVKACPLGAHFATFEEAEAYANIELSKHYGTLGAPITVEVRKMHDDDVPEGFNRYSISINSKPEEFVSNYYQSPEAIAFFEQNRQVVLEEDFDLMMISWATNKEIVEDMKNNKIGDAKYTYGDIIRVLEQEVIDEYKIDGSLGIEERYLEGRDDIGSTHYNYIDEEFWEEQMAIQKIRYGHLDKKIANKLGYKEAKIFYLPMEARIRLEQDGYLSNANDLSDVVYKVCPPETEDKNLVAYNHNNGRIYKEFDAYQVAGVVEGHTLNDYTNEINTEREFEDLWNSEDFTPDESVEDDYDSQYEAYRQNKFMRGISRLEVPRAFAKFSPIASKEIRGFTDTHKSIARVIGSILGEDTSEQDYEHSGGTGSPSAPFSFFRKSS